MTKICNGSVIAGKQARGSVLTFFAPKPLEKIAGLTPDAPRHH